MNCATHPEATATGFCRNCGKAMCAQCSREVRGALYCEECLAQRVSGATLPPPAASVDSHAALACALGFIPGLGAVYNGEYTKALVHVLIFGGIIAGLSQDLPTVLYPLLAVSLAVFYFYMPIDAYRTARAKALEKSGAVASEAGAIPAPAPSSLRSPIGAVILIGIGILFLLANFGVLREDWINKGWPLILVAVGVWLIIRRMSCPSD